MHEVAGLFAGIGGLELGFRESGFRTSLLCEIDPCARSVLSERFPGIPLAEDVAQLRVMPPRTSVAAAGFPCQDLSQPGTKQGLLGAKSGLVFHVFRLAAASRSLEWLVLENVPFMLRLGRGAAMSRVTSELEALGWRWAYRTVDAICAVPQRRRRVIILASPCHSPADVLFGHDYPAPDERSWAPGVSSGFYWTEGRNGAGLRREAVPTLKVGSGVGIPSAPAVLRSDGSLGMPSIEDAEALQGFPRGWTAGAGTAGKGARWRLVGNAVPPPLSAWAARCIASPPGVSATVRSGPLDTARGWPAAAWFDGRTRHAVRIGEAFMPGPRPLLSEHLLDPLTPLSPRAIRGFLSRASSGGLRWPPGFLERVAGHG